MKYKVGDRVKIKSLDWYDENKDVNGFVRCGDRFFDNYMSLFCGEVVTISWVYPHNKYDIREDIHYRTWTDEMIEGLVEEETLIERVDDNGLPFNEWLSHKGAFHVPDGYELKDENGNIINATKIVLEKKKEYPKTYEECCKVLGVDSDNFLTIRNAHRYDGEEETTDYERDLLNKFNSLWELRICRDAYWKIAGEEMGLGKPWEPDFNNENEYKYGLFRLRNIIYKDATCIIPTLFVFPTPEMRDAFCENFKKEIEICKELL